MSRPPSESLRIVSLLPSATEILACLGLGDRIVGRSHECDYPPEVGDRPICTASSIDTQKSSAAIDADVQTMVQNALSLYTVKLEVLENLRPTHIVTQDQCDVCAVNFAEVEKAVGQLIQSHPTIISLQPHTLEDVWIDIQHVANAFGVDAAPVLNGLRQRIQICQQKTQNLAPSKRPTVATLEWLDPLMGSGNWIPELVDYAGGRDCFGTTGQPSPYITWKDLHRADPDIIVVLPCGFDLERTRQELESLYDQPQWQALKAVRTQQLYLADGNAYFNRPGPRLVDSLEILSEIFHPNLFASRYRGTAWERM